MVIIIIRASFLCFNQTLCDLAVLFSLVFPASEYSSVHSGSITEVPGQLMGASVLSLLSPINSSEYRLSEVIGMGWKMIGRLIASTFPTLLTEFILSV